MVRYLTMEAMREVGWTIQERVEIRLEVAWPNRRSWWDTDNLIAAWKPGRDAIVQAGVVRDDSYQCMRTPEPVYVVDPTVDRPTLRVSITSLDSEPQVRG